MKKEQPMHSNPNGLKWGDKNEIIAVIILSIISGVLVQLPYWINHVDDIFFRRNLSYIILPGLSIYFGIINKFSKLKLGLIVGFAIVCASFTNGIPGNDTNDAFIMSCVHMVFVWFFVLGISYVGSFKNQLDKRIEFLKFLGDLAIISGLMLAAVGLISGMTIGLFSVIGISIENYFFQKIALWGIVSIPFIGSTVLKNNPTILSNITSLIARIFSPVVLVMLSVYLVAILTTGKDPYNDREFLMIFNLLLIIVMALIIFSTGVNKDKLSKFQSIVLSLLSGVTIIVCGIALSAILFRIAEWGLTPNRVAVLGSNVLIFAHLLLVFKSLINYQKNNTSNQLIENTIAVYMPVYFIWFLFVSFLFPLIF